MGALRRELIEPRLDNIQRTPRALTSSPLSSSDLFDSDVRKGSRLCKNALLELNNGRVERGTKAWRQALIASISGLVPMMAMTRLRCRRGHGVRSRSSHWAIALSGSASIPSRP